MTDDDPITASAVAIGASSALGATGSVVGGMQAQKSGIEQAHVFEQQSKLDLQAAGARIGEEDYNAVSAIQRGAAETGAAGLTASSTRTILNENAAQQNIRDMYTRYSGQLASQRDLYQASLSKYEGKQALFRGMFGGVQNILGGAAGIGQMKALGGLNIGGGGKP